MQAMTCLIFHASSSHCFRFIYSGVPYWSFDLALPQQQGIPYTYCYNNLKVETDSQILGVNVFHPRQLWLFDISVDENLWVDVSRGSIKTCLLIKYWMWCELQLDRRNATFSWFWFFTFLRIGFVKRLSGCWNNEHCQQFQRKVGCSGKQADLFQWQINIFCGCSPL